MPQEKFRLVTRSDFDGLVCAVLLNDLDGGSPANGGVRLPAENGVTGNDRGQLVSRPLVSGGCVNAAWATQTVIFYNVNCGRQEPVVASTIPVELKGKRTAGVEFRQAALHAGW